MSSKLAKKGHHVDVATSNYPISDPVDRTDGFAIFRFPCLARPMRNPIAPHMVRLDKVIDSYDVIHAHNEHTASTYIAWRLAKKHNIPLVITCHGQLKFGNMLLDMVEKSYSKMIASRILKDASAVCALSPKDREYLLSLGRLDPSRVEIVSNAIDPDQLNREEGAELREEVRNICDSDGRKVLFVGRLSKRKGVEQLIRAMGSISRDRSLSDVKLVMVGKGEEHGRLQSMIGSLGLQDRVNILNYVSEEELYSLYRCSDIFTLPSLSEGCPTVILEAMYFGLPVVATNIPGIRDHFKDTAWLVPPLDDVKLADSISTLAKSEKLSESMRKAGRDNILEKYTWDKLATHHESIYDCVKSETDSVRIAVGQKRATKHCIEDLL